MNKAFFRISIIAGASIMLPGCVAAIIPVAAGGLLAKGHTNRNSKSDDKAQAQIAVPSPPPPLVDVEAAPQQVAPLDDPAQTSPQQAASSVSITQAPPPPSQEEMAAKKGPDLGAKLVSEAEESVELAPKEDQAATPDKNAGITEIPATLIRSETAPRRQTTKRDYADFYGHAAAMASRDPIDDPLHSAILEAPGLLNPATTQCGILPPAVLLDLDPGKNTFDPDHDSPPNPPLAKALAALRVQNVEVFWISMQSAGQAGAIRQRLVSSGLDPFGRDPLILMRGKGERKQTRRRELANSHCLVAIAGDTRGDFDELFDYLKDPSAAAPLEVLFGTGWFLTPAPLIAPLDKDTPAKPEAQATPGSVD